MNHATNKTFHVLATGDAEAYRSLKMTVKVPPAFDGHVQTSGYFAYEESVEEWESITTIEQKYPEPFDPSGRRTARASPGI